MKKMNRREFAKRVSGAVLVAPLAPVLIPGGMDAPASVAAAAHARPAQTGQQLETPKAEARPKLTAEQEERVKRAIERRERQLAAIRSRELAYSAEPAFVFRVRHREVRK